MEAFDQSIVYYGGDFCLLSVNPSRSFVYHMVSPSILSHKPKHISRYYPLDRGAKFSLYFRDLLLSFIVTSFIVNARFFLFLEKAKIQLKYLNELNLQIQDHYLNIAFFLLQRTHIQMLSIFPFFRELLFAQLRDFYLVSELVEVNFLITYDTTMPIIMFKYRQYTKSAQYITDANNCLDIQFSYMHCLHVHHYGGDYSFSNLELYCTLHDFSWSTSGCSYLVSICGLCVDTMLNRTSYHFIVNKYSDPVLSIVFHPCILVH